MLTDYDRRGLPWLVIAVRPNGDRLVLAEASTRRAAMTMASRFRRHLTGVKEVVVELVGHGGGPDEKQLTTRAAADLVAEAKSRGKTIHMGRVNTLRRIQTAYDLGCDSVDGSCFSRWADRLLEWALFCVVRLERQPVWWGRPDGAGDTPAIWCDANVNALRV